MSTFVQYAPSSYGQVQSNFTIPSQYQPVSQIQAPTVSSGEQVRLSMSTASGTSLLSSGEQPSIPTVTPPVCVLLIPYFIFVLSSICDTIRFFFKLQYSY